MNLLKSLVIIISAQCIIFHVASASGSLKENIRAEIKEANSKPEAFSLPRSERPLGSSKTNRETERIGRISNRNIRIYRRYRGSREEKDVIEALNEQSCNPFTRIRCDSRSKFRTIDGTCNNLIEPRAGSSGVPFERILPAEFEDGFNSPRVTSRETGAALPNARKVSTVIDPDVRNPDSSATNMVPQIGQFLDHDITLTPEAGRDCCGAEAEHEDCDPITIPADDPFYSNLENAQTCMNFTRSTAYCFPGDNAIRRQFNMNTAFIDGSQIYASDHTRAGRIRLMRDGLLRENRDHPGILPTVAEIKSILNEDFEFQGEYFGGDDRVNEMPALTAMHTLFLREHNRIARELKECTDWNDEEIYQFTRRIVIAQWQKIIYHDYLPVVLGEDTMKRFELNVLGNSRRLYSKYVRKAYPNIMNSFATAAYRFGHSLLNGIIQLFRGSRNVGSYELSRNFFRTGQLERDNYDGYNVILGGLMVQNSEGFDPYVTSAVTNFLFREEGSSFGSDLIARNIHRGRDHGLPSYNEFRKLCQLNPLSRDWNNRPFEVRNSTWVKLSRLYEYPVDIDLFTGGLAEYAVVGGLSGPTFNCLKARQFWTLKFGDRYFFTHWDQPKRFSSSQLRMLGRRSLSNIICDNSNLGYVTFNPFRIPSSRNRMVRCSQIKKGSLNLHLFLK